MKPANVEDVRYKIRSKKGLYKLLEKRQIFLPSFYSKAITKDYLIHLLKENLFYIKSNLIPHSVLMDSKIT